MRRHTPSALRAVSPIALAIAAALPGAAHAERVELTPTGADVVPGVGFDAATGDLAQRCVQAAGVVTEGASSSDLRFDRPLGRDASLRGALLERLGLQSGKRLRLVALRAAHEAQLVDLARASAERASVAFGGSFRLAAERASLATVSELGLGAPRSALGLRRTCGDRFVSAVERGGRLFVVVAIEGPNMDRRLLDGSLAAIRARLAALPASDPTVVEVAVLQHGGDPAAARALLGDAATTPSEGALPRLRCEAARRPDCAAALEALEAYGRERFATEVTNKPVPVTLELERYEAAGLKTPPDKANAKRDKAIEPLEAELASSFGELEAERRRAEAARATARRLASRIEARRRLLERRLEQLADAIQACHGQDERACKLTIKDLGPRPGLLVLDVIPEDFREHCEARGLPGADPRVAALFPRLEAWASNFDPEWTNEPDRCQALATRLEDALELDLVGLGLRSLSVLSGLTFRRLETLRLQGNPIESLGALTLGPGVAPRTLVSVDPSTLRGTTARFELKREEGYELPWTMNATLRATPLVKLGIPAGRICVAAGASGEWRSSRGARERCGDAARTVELTTPPSRVQEISWSYDDADGKQEGTCTLRLRCWED